MLRRARRACHAAARHERCWRSAGERDMESSHAATRARCERVLAALFLLSHVA